MRNTVALMSASRKKWLCMDCKIDTGKIGEHYMLIDSVWSQVHSSKKGMLCIGCLEQRLDRIITARDFNTSYINKPRVMSNRLMKRLMSGNERKG